MYKYESLSWLVSTLFTDEFIEHPYANSTFGMLTALTGQEENTNNQPAYQTMEERTETVQRFIAENKDVSKCLDKAEDAVQSGEIEKPNKRYDEWGEEVGCYEEGKVGTYSFYLWAEKQGYKVSEQVITKLEPIIQMAVYEKHADEEIRRIYPKISKYQFNEKSKEPLWLLANGILYLLGHRNSRDGNTYTPVNSKPTIEDFISKSPHGKKLLKYAGDAAIAGQLTLIGDKNLAETDEELLETFVEPSAFIKWAKAMPVILPIFSEEENYKDAPKYKTKDMQLLNDAVEHFWTEYDLENPDPSLAPFKKDVVKWLMAEAKKRDIQDFSESRAKVMDTIIRCPKSRGGGNTL